MNLRRSILAVLLLPAFLPAADLTGNWVVSPPAEDSGRRGTYFNLKQEKGSRITGTIRSGQFYYHVKESSGGPDGLTLTGSMMDGRDERRVTYQGKLAGDELHILMPGRGGAGRTQVVAHRAPEGEGAYPARVEPPRLHKVPDNGLAKTPPMGWNSWNKFRNRVNDAVVREIADAMAAN